MTNTCISDCIGDTHVPSRRAYLDFHHEWSESDCEFSRSISFSSRRQVINGHPVLVDSISCRQLYLRSYTFTRKESVGEKTKKCFVKVGAKVKHSKLMIKRFQGCDKDKTRSFDRRKYLRVARDASCAAFLSAYRRLLSCCTIAKVDAHDDDDEHHHEN